MTRSGCSAPTSSPPSNPWSGRRPLLADTERVEKQAASLRTGTGCSSKRARPTRRAALSGIKQPITLEEGAYQRPGRLVSVKPWSRSSGRPLGSPKLDISEARPVGEANLLL